MPGKSRADAPFDRAAIFRAIVEHLMSDETTDMTGNMRLQHWAVLSILFEFTDAEHPLSAQQFADQFGQHRTAMNLILLNLLDRGLVQRDTTHASHGRGRSFVYFTDRATLRTWAARSTRRKKTRMNI